MYGKKSRNITDLAEPRDWIVGTGGVKRVSAGYGRIIYAMRVDEKITLTKYYSDLRFKGRIDNLKCDRNNNTRYALISQHYFYFGEKAISISKVPQIYLDHPLEKKGPRFRSDFTPRFIEQFTKWLERKYHVGMHGDPCRTSEDNLNIRLKCQSIRIVKIESIEN